ncbi:hypothetical protein BZA70DRAFT_277531 [Myxozyma melibiosi]|uniref:F-box domain-containing protein n=1 Tax=Myxozyma melibiosi TaxID=54550 RepID=A0ABR1F834_9ASCO
MVLLDALPDELLEHIVGLLAPPFSTAASVPMRRDMLSLSRQEKEPVRSRITARPVFDLKGSRILKAQQVVSPQSAGCYSDLANLACVSHRFHALVTPLLYQNITLRVCEVNQALNSLLIAARGPSGAFVRSVSIRDPDPAVHPRIINPKYRNKLIFAFSNFLMNFFEALSIHPTLTSFHWNVFDTLIFSPLFMDSLPPGIQEFTLDQGRVIPLTKFELVKKFVYRAHMLSFTSNCLYERRISKFLSLNFASLQFLQLQNVNLAVCFEFRSPNSAMKQLQNLGTRNYSETTVHEISHLIENAIQDGLKSQSEEKDKDRLDASVHSSRSESPRSQNAESSDSDSVDESVKSQSLSHTLDSPQEERQEKEKEQDINISEFTNTSADRRLSLPDALPIIFPSLENAYFTDFFTSSSVASFSCEWLTLLLAAHVNNKNLCIKYASRLVNKDAIFAREWGLVQPVPHLVGLNGQPLTDEETFRRAGYAVGTKSGQWNGWNWEYSTIKGWSFSTISNEDKQ